MCKKAGILMPISSLPSPYGIGTLGRAAYDFVDFLHACGCRLWQVLPLQPTSYGDSPYSSFSAFALNHYFIDLDLLCNDGLLTRTECETDWGESPRRVDYGKLYERRVPVLQKAFSRFHRTMPAWKAFLREGKYRDYALFMALKAKFGGVSHERWGQCSEYDQDEVAQFEATHSEEVLFWQFTQFVFLQQWNALKAYAHLKGVEIVGDIPYYVARDSVETWKYKKELFLLNAEGVPAAQAGVPPDSFSERGQLWGNPVYDWARMRQNGYAWWRRRFEDGLALYDYLRIDHFIGFARYYKIPADATEAIRGTWEKGPGAEPFKGYENSRIVAEDLGIVTDEVRDLLKRTGYPGMKILQYGFDGSECNEHRPSRYLENCFAYTGTHDNETLMEKLSAMNEAEFATLCGVLKAECKKVGVVARCTTKREVCRSILRLLLFSRAKIVIFPLQDALCMGEEGRINRPSTVSSNNWSFRFIKKDFSRSLCKRLQELIRLSGR